MTMVVYTLNVEPPRLHNTIRSQQEDVFTAETPGDVGQIRSWVRRCIDGVRRAVREAALSRSPEPTSPIQQNFQPQQTWI